MRVRSIIKKFFVDFIFSPVFSISEDFYKIAFLTPVDATKNKIGMKEMGKILRFTIVRWRRKV